MEWLSVPRPGSWALIIAPHAGVPLMLDLAARLGSRGSVSVVDGGDRFQAHVVSRAVRRYLPPGSGGQDHAAALERIMLARAFTCYQMVTLLDEYLAHPQLRTPPGRWFPRGRTLLIGEGRLSKSAPGSSPHSPFPPPPTLVLDLLSTFYDESVPLAESQRLLGICISYLERMAKRAPLAVSVKPPRPVSDRQVLVERLEAAASEVYRLEAPTPVEPPRLF
ncbi:MAG: hypothetical protein R3335_08405 [Anaerolineales bacterium]|nr:hypothetical protein [Anaerolineales bacterium]